ncbi:MAG: CDP-alcohol phosphatidyltransferase family protein [Candidatus Firestonebacteria bacterium]
MKTITLPNILTVLRILSTPLFVIFFKTDIKIATLIFIVAMITDILDGIIARINKSRSTLGSILDPLADKILINTAFLLLASTILIPDWMVVTIISRDIILILGWLLIFIITSNIKIEPSIFGKFTNFLQSTSVILLLLLPQITILNIYLYIMIVFTMISLLDYLIKGIKRMG